MKTPGQCPGVFLFHTKCLIERSVRPAITLGIAGNLKRLNLLVGKIEKQFAVFVSISLKVADISLDVNITLHVTCM